MSTVKEEFDKLKAKMMAGKGDERCTPAIVVRDEIKKRTEKPRPGEKARTTFVFPTGHNDFYRELNLWKDKVIDQAGNKTIGIELLVRAWRELAKDPARIARWIEEGAIGPPF